MLGALHPLIFPGPGIFVVNFIKQLHNISKNENIYRKCCYEYSTIRGYLTTNIALSIIIWSAFAVLSVYWGKTEKMCHIGGALMLTHFEVGFANTLQITWLSKEQNVIVVGDMANSWLLHRTGGSQLFIVHSLQRPKAKLSPNCFVFFVPIFS